MRIALDAMGSDDRPVADVAGAVLAAREFGCEIKLIGNEAAVGAELTKHDTAGLKIDVIHSDDEITMDDKPARVVKGKPNSSMHIGMGLVKDGEADGFVTAGNTGAALAIATLHTIRRIRGVKRPALATVYPFHDELVTILDVGANTDCRPDWMAQFAIMGSVYAGSVQGIRDPGVALISSMQPHGDTALIKETDAILRQLPLNYIGRIPPAEVARHDVHVVVTDGFVGNILMKTYESTLRYVGRELRQAFRKTPRGLLAGLLLRRGIQQMRAELDPVAVGGAPLLGVNGVVIVGHGGSNDEAIKNAVRQAIRAVEQDLVGLIQEGMKDLDAIEL